MELERFQYPLRRKGVTDDVPNTLNIQIGIYTANCSSSSLLLLSFLKTLLKFTRTELFNTKKSCFLKDKYYFIGGGVSLWDTGVQPG